MASAFLSPEVADRYRQLLERFERDYYVKPHSLGSGPGVDGIQSGVGVLKESGSVLCDQHKLYLYTKDQLYAIELQESGSFRAYHSSTFTECDTLRGLLTELGVSFVVGEWLRAVTPARGSLVFGGSGGGGGYASADDEVGRGAGD